MRARSKAFLTLRALANNGFSALALRLFEQELEFIKDDKIKATIFNYIGGVYSDLDEYDKAIDYFKRIKNLRARNCIFKFFFLLWKKIKMTFISSPNLLI